MMPMLIETKFDDVYNSVNKSCDKLINVIQDVKSSLNKAQESNLKEIELLKELERLNNKLF